MKIKHLFLCLLVLSLASVRGLAQSKSSLSQSQTDSVAVMKTINGFVDAFVNLRWDDFSNYFADNATSFFPPSAKTPARANNKVETMTIFRKVFDNARARRTSAPYLDIQPKDVRVQLIGSLAIVTFHLLDPDLFSRRTLVLSKEEQGSWKIVHMHGSGVAYK
ncbi:MAG: nuclear transport factor 2 family protein [Cyclobacteriaceae bacterium]